MLWPARHGLAPACARREAAEGTSSTGRASVSKTEGWGFKSLVPCKANARQTGPTTVSNDEKR